MDDGLILELYWARSESAIAETSLKYGAYCLSIAMNIVQNREDADECVNDTYLKTWNAIPPQRPTIFSSFLGKITRNQSINRYKQQRAIKRGGSEVELVLDELADCISSGSAVEAEYEMGVIANSINCFLKSMDAESRIVFVRRYWYVDSILSIAERFKMSESKVKSSLFRTRKKLKVHLEKEGVKL